MKFQLQDQDCGNLGNGKVVKKSAVCEVRRGGEEIGMEGESEQAKAHSREKTLGKAISICN